MHGRVRVLDNSAIVKLISGGPKEPDTGLILRGAVQCIELAEELIQAAEEIQKNEKRKFEQNESLFKCSEWRHG
jgi:hypothetical protein